MTIRPLDHTGDVGYDIVAPSRDAVYAEAARAFVHAITDPARIAAADRREIRVEATDGELLLVEWLDELLYLFETDGWLPATVEPSVEDDASGVTLTAVLSGERFDASRHELRVPIKAVTLHDLRLRQEGAAWRARVIFDI